MRFPETVRGEGMGSGLAAEGTWRVSNFCKNARASHDLQAKSECKICPSQVTLEYDLEFAFENADVMLAAGRSAISESPRLSTQHY